MRQTTPAQSSPHDQPSLLSTYSGADYNQALTKPYRFALGGALALIGLVIISFSMPAYLYPAQANFWRLMLVVTGLVFLRFKKQWLLFVFVAPAVVHTANPPRRVRLYGQPIRDQEFDLLSQMMIVIFILAFIALGYRYLEQHKYSQGFLSEKERSSGDKIPPPQSMLLSLISGRWIVMIGSALAAAIMLSAIPQSTSTVREYWLQPAPARLIGLVFLIFFIWFVARGVVSFLSRKDLTPEVAQITMRAAYNREHWKELAPIERRRMLPRYRKGMDE